MKKVYSIVLILLLFFTFFSIAVQAQTPNKPEDAGDSKGTVRLNNPLATEGQPNPTPQLLIGRIISAVLGLVGSLALLMFIYGGFTWMTAAGNSEKVEKGKNIIIWAVIGLAVIFTSYAVVKFVFTSLQV